MTTLSLTHLFLAFSVCNNHNVKMEPCVKYHTKAKCHASKKSNGSSACQNQHGFPVWMTNKFCPDNLSERRHCDGKCLLSHEPIIDFIRDYKAWLPDGCSRIFRSHVFGPAGFWTMAPLRCAAKFDPFLSLDCAPTPSTLYISFKTMTTKESS